MGIVVALGAAVAFAEAANKLIGVVDSARSIIITVENHTDHTWTRQRVRFDHGGFREPASSQIPPRSAELFSVQDRGFATGVEGFIVYQVDGGDVKVRIRFNNPWIGSNKGSAVAYRREKVIKLPGFPQLTVPDPKSAEDYAAIATAGRGNDARFRYEMRRR